MKKIIELQNVNFSYGRGKPKAIDNVSLGIGEGVYGLLGPNGAGKTTLMKILLGFLEPSSGGGSVLGFDITTGQKAVRERIGYMPESDCLMPGMDAVTLTAYLGELSGMPKQEAMKRAHEVLYYVGLEEARYRKVETYSAGMKQRLKLAQALVHDPKLLFLDEPSSGMDPKGRKEMLELIKDIAGKESMNIIISTHLLPDVEYTCEHVIILNKGQVVYERDVAAKAEEKFNRFEIKIQGEAAHKEQFLNRLKSLDCSVNSDDRGMHTVLFPKDQAPRSLFKIALEANIQIRHFQQSKATLEDTFVSAVGANNDN
ncbi:MAG: ATP-binding cassette domain-containing protein [Candidatus Aminicenantes bacterium]|nr:ATP-binding cassette domain-containing protein [Candidatus Aminicenantes bacterium]NIM83360.1 ATP-binding cassette domain-containing protein [Candidatus Aminicenantes bacterium]NIN22724.1 ATP-binding cassette domain-containing protein [Candidatus Aminicenantes bacterium]NIN46484.1 ATP-binding cassette domain-containing protein [Candidatus Aminicenantes bacterium]NIN89366.1 ATP-binding cassette domain-containing protein [Candidatus Aminicenantes bacterium]